MPGYMRIPVNIFICALIFSQCRMAAANDYPVGKEPKYDPYYEEALSNKGVQLTPLGLSAALHDKNPQIRAYASTVIRQRDMAQLDNELASAFQAEEAASVKIRMAETLIAFGNELPVPYLKSLIEKAEVNSESITAAGLLLSRGVADGYPLLKKGMTYPDQSLRVESIYQLSSYNDYSGEKSKDLEASIYADLDYVLSNDASVFVKMEAARELSDIGSDDAMEILEKHKNVQDEKLRNLVNLYINKIQAKKAAD